MASLPGRESGRAFLRFARKDRCQPQFGLVGQRLVGAETKLVVAAATIRAQALLGERGDLGGQGDRGVEGCPVRDDSVDQSHPQRLVTRHAATGQDQVEGMTVTDQAGEADGAAVDQRYAPPTAIHPEHGVRRRHAEITPQRQFQAAGDGVTLDGSNDRLVEQHACRSHRAVQRHVAIRPGCHFPSRSA